MKRKWVLRRSGTLTRLYGSDFWGPLRRSIGRESKAARAAAQAWRTRAADYGMPAQPKCLAGGNGRLWLLDS